MFIRTAISLFLASFFLFVGNAFGQSDWSQFGKNNVRYNSLDQFYKSYRFDVWHNLDSQDPVQMEYLRQVVKNLEGARDWMGSSKIFNHSIEERIPIFFYKTHTDMESSNLVGGFMPEGVGAFVESGRKRMVLKADFSRPLGRAIGVHELAHEFQFDIYNPSLIQKAVGSVKLPNGWYEGCAEFLAGLYDPHTRDDIRRREQRNYASNPKTLPTWSALNSGAVNPYTMWSMIPEFLEEKYSGGGVGFCTQPLKNRVGLGEYIYDLSKGELGNPDFNSEKFDQSARYYWGTEKGFEMDRINRPKPYEENENFKGWTVTPYGHPYAMRSPKLSPDGSQIAAFSIQKNGVSLIQYAVPQETVYISKEERAKLAKKNSANQLMQQRERIKNLTPQLPPVPWEYLVVQGFETWPFDGSDVDWSRDGKQIAFFARVNRDHALVIVDAVTGEVLRKIELESPSLDQAFSPSFSPDGKKVYFSAAKSITRNLYVIDLETGETVNLTSHLPDQAGSFDTAPVISPDGTRIAYVSLVGDFQHLFMLNIASGEREQLTFGAFNDSSPNWSDDGSTLVYTSDEADRIPNLYTLELATRTVSQWTEFMGGLETPMFDRGSLDKVYYLIFRDDDQYRNFIYPNFEIFAAKLKKPIRQFVAGDTKEPINFAFNPNRDLFEIQLDENQMLNPVKPEEKWSSRGYSTFGGNLSWGVANQSYVEISNILETKKHQGFMVFQGSMKIFSYSYLNQEKRTSWSLAAHHYQFPLYFQFWDMAKQYPKQEVLKRTWMKESSVGFVGNYPMNKFNRFEFSSGVRRRSFSYSGQGFEGFNEGIFDLFPDYFTEQDRQMLRFFKASGDSNMYFGAAYVRDTVLFSPNTWGPWHGNALRAQVEAGPSIGKLGGYVSTNVQARTYRHFGSSVVFAGRVDLMASTKANGDFMLLCGPERLRGCDYGSIAGNQVAYGSAEIRFPIPGTYLLYQNFRGLLFADGALSRFSNDELSGQKNKAYGFGVQYIVPMVGLPVEVLWKRNNGKWDPTFYISMNW